MDSCATGGVVRTRTFSVVIVLGSRCESQILPWVIESVLVLVVNVETLRRPLASHERPRQARFIIATTLIPDLATEVTRLPTIVANRTGAITRVDHTTTTMGPDLPSEHTSHRIVIQHFLQVLDTGHHLTA